MILTYSTGGLTGCFGSSSIIRDFLLSGQRQPAISPYNGGSTIYVHTSFSIDILVFVSTSAFLSFFRCDPRPYVQATLTLSLLMSYIYGAPSKARNLTSYINIYIYIDEIFYLGICFLNRAFR
jgi:hypothetical protein